MVRRWLLVATALTGLSACKFSEKITAPVSDPFLVVHGILNTREVRRFVTVERSIEGITTGVTGARVDLTHLDPGSCLTPTVRLDELSSPQPGVPTAGVYLTNRLCPLHPGDRVALRVETPDGHVVTGTTRIPGASNINVRGGSGFPPGGCDPGGCGSFNPSGTIALDRTKDSLRVSADSVVGRALQVEVVRNDVGGFPTFRLATDTMALTIAGNLVDPFDGDGRTVFRAGAYYLITAAVTDSNYFDFIRSGSDPFTGRGFINHLTGAVGVFGSLVPMTYTLFVYAPQVDPREGVYRLTGQLSGQSVDITWDLYRDALTLGGNGFSGFVDGTWIDGPVQTSANVLVIGPDGPTPNAFTGQIFNTTGQFPGQVGETFELSGTRAPRGTPFPLQVIYQRGGRTVTDTLTAVQVSGPS